MLASLVLLLPTVLVGQIFRYQDEFGNWHFTDDPPEGYETSVVPDIDLSIPSRPDSGPADDLAARLEAAFEPITPIAYATLAVVSIKSDVDEGSGFFCTDQGHILTNKHVIRPDLSDALGEHQQSTDAREQELTALESSLKETRRQLQIMEGDLKGYDDLIESVRDDKTQSWARDARQRLSQQYHAERGKISEMESRFRALKTEMRNWEQDLSFATIKNRFDIVLKDGTELVATLVDIKEDQDLALLKLDGYRTPFLKLDPSGSLSQGARVFAIGNSLGMQDAVTSGVITQIAPGHLLTDAQILPGSSGGPLIGENGEVIGINVSRRVAAGTSKYAVGFGNAIPISQAIEAFPDVLRSSVTRAVEAVPTAPPPGTSRANNFRPPAIESRVPGQSWSFGSNIGGTPDSAPIRLIVPDEVGGSDHVPSASNSEPRSLDFPAEGSWKGIPPGISLPQH